MKYTLNNGYIVATIIENCGFEEFYKIAELIEKNIKCSFDDKVDDFDTKYWGFKYKCESLVLFYNIYEGIQIYPFNGTNFPEDKYVLVREISEKIHKFYQDRAVE